MRLQTVGGAVFRINPKFDVLNAINVNLDIGSFHVMDYVDLEPSIIYVLEHRGRVVNGELAGVNSEHDGSCT